MTPTPSGRTGPAGPGPAGPSGGPAANPTGSAVAAGSTSAAYEEGMGVEVRPVVRQRVARRNRRRRRATVGQGVFTALAVVVLIGLVWFGWSSTLRITGGRSEVVTDPSAPGYVAEVRPTAVDLVAVTGDGGELISMLLVISEPGDGGVVAVPLSPRTILWEFEGAAPESAVNVFAQGGIDVLRLRLGAELTFGTTDAVVIPGERLVELARPAGGVTLTVADDVFAGAPDADPSEVTLQYPAGEVELQPDEVDDFLAFPGYREPDPNRAVRSGALWSALLDAADLQPAPADGTAIDDMADDPFAELLGRLASGVVIQLAPTVSGLIPTDPPVEVHRIDPDAMPEWVATHVGFPVSAYPGQRATVALLDGTGDDAAIRAAAPPIVEAGGEVALTGNADSFDIDVTRVEHQRVEARNAAADIAAALGATAIEEDGRRSDVDVTVVVGKDLVR